jgi:hypothetical protein
VPRQGDRLNHSDSILRYLHWRPHRLRIHQPVDHMLLRVGALQHNGERLSEIRRRRKGVTTDRNCFNRQRVLKRKCATISVGAGDGGDKTLCSKGTCAGRDPSLGQLKKPELPSPQALPSTPIKMMKRATKSKKSEQNEEKFCVKSTNKKSPARIPFSNR